MKMGKPKAMCSQVGKKTALLDYSPRSRLFKASELQQQRQRLLRVQDDLLFWAVDSLLHPPACLRALGRGRHELSARRHQVREELGPPPLLAPTLVLDPSLGQRPSNQGLLRDQQNAPGKVENRDGAPVFFSEQFGGHQPAGCRGELKLIIRCLIVLLFSDVEHKNRKDTSLS